MHVRTAATVTAEGSPAICICLHVRSVRRILQIPMFTLSLRALRARIVKPSQAYLWLAPAGCQVADWGGAPVVASCDHAVHSALVSASVDSIDNRSWHIASCGNGAP